MAGFKVVDRESAGERLHRRKRSESQSSRHIARQPGGYHDHLSFHLRCVRRERERDLRASSTRNGGQVYMDGANMNAQVGLTRSRPHWRGRLSPEPPQDLCHPARRRRPRHGPHLRGQTPCAIPARPREPAERRQRASRLNAVSAAPYGSCQHPADLLCIHPFAGR